jgi:uncharacterized heparinase superfamily protein
MLRRVAQEAGAGLDRFSAGRRARLFDVKALLCATEEPSLDTLWDRLAARPFPSTTARVDRKRYDGVCPGDAARILTLAERAVAHEVDLLGSGPIRLGVSIDWLTDHKTGHSWPPAFMRDIEYNNLDRDSDVKFPWELSRLQWLIPAGQAFLLTGDERYARAVGEVIDQWIAGNPYAGTVNWSCTMEVALRMASWTWFFHALGRSRSWADPAFRGRFLVSLFLHGRFTAKYLEHSDVNGNHCTADAAGLVFAGLFFDRGSEPARWLRMGWDLLVEELPKQVTPDGVDYEASLAYHRLVLELFLWPALYRESCGLTTPAPYRQRLNAMARYVVAYSRRDGSTPLLGDADDGRMLPFGGQPLTDHRYLIGLVALAGDDGLMPLFSGPASEVFWACGEEAVGRLTNTDQAQPTSCAFADAGYFVMRNSHDHVFVDCAPVGLAGRGGHGHNDCLSFEAALDGVLLVSDCGSYVYTASAAERNRFRSTAYHNTPQVDGEEINRFVGWDHLWTLHDDAVAQVARWEAGFEADTFAGAHSGYHRLGGGVTPSRTLTLAHRSHALTISDVIGGTGEHSVMIPLHLAPGVMVRHTGPRELRLVAGGREFRLSWSSPHRWTFEIERGRISPRYGVVAVSVRLAWRSAARLPTSLTMCIAPAALQP